MAEEEKKDERRSFLGPDELTSFYVAAPTAEDIRGADWTYSKTYTKCLVEGITTSAEMMDILMRRGIIGPEFEQRGEELTIGLNEKIMELESAGDMDEKRTSAIGVANSREELFQWNQRLNGPMSNTCEQIADDARLEFLTANMIENEDGSKVWDSYDTYLKEKSQALALRARFEVMLYLQGLDSNFLEGTPEAMAMKEIEADVIKRAEEAVKVAKAMTEELEEKEAAKAKLKKKKPGRKKAVAKKK
ncbi:MAG: hypothetical protein ACTSV7_03065 [Candidatus Baldrarchaeia archaeon]